MAKRKNIFTDEKKWHQSKTMRINALGFVAGVAMLLQGDLQSGSILSVATVVNAILRYVTKSEIKF